MTGVNVIMFGGHLGKDPEMRVTSGGKNVATVSVASGKKYRGGDGEMKDETTWMNVIFWEKKADLLCQFFKKGSPILVRGRIQVRSWEDQQSGTTKWATEIVADELFFIESKNSGESRGSSVEQSDTKQEGATESDLPF